MSNSPLVVYTKLSPNYTKGRARAIDTITIHCMAGNASIETCGAIFAPSSRQASSNYGIGTDGRIGMYVEECNRSWCTSSGANDNRAVTIEVANTVAAEPWPVSDKALAALIDLCTDICRRNTIKRLLWLGDKGKIGMVDLQNMSVHRWFAAKACPGNYLYERHSYIAAEVNKRLGTAAAPSTPASPATPVTDTAKAIWDFFTGKGLNAFAVAGLMGNLSAESGLLPNNLQNSFEKKLGYTDATYTAAVDSGKYTNFVRDSAGYGLAQWTFWSRKQALLDFAKAAKASIGDLSMQLNYLWKELQGYTVVMSTLKTATSVRAASNVVLLQFERPADQSVTVQNKRDAFGQGYYDKYAGKTAAAPPAPSAPSTPTPAPTGHKVGDIVQFTGGAVYTSANAAVPAHSRGKSKCKVTQVYNGKHPYHLVSQDGQGVYGWVDSGDVASASVPAAFVPYTVRVTASSLTIRKGPGTSYGANGAINDKGIYTIIEESDGPGAKKWGKLKSGAGWISLDYTRKA